MVHQSLVVTDPAAKERLGFTQLALKSKPELPVQLAIVTLLGG
jgi:hypothetical protein